MKFFIANLRTLLKKFTASTIINIAGMTAGFTVFIIVALQVKYDLTYDKSYGTDKEIYKFFRVLPVVENGKQEEIRSFGRADGKTWMNTQQLLYTVAEGMPEIENFCLYWANSRRIYKINSSDQREIIPYINLYYVTPGFEEIFNPQTIAGNVEGELNIPGRAIVTEKTAEQIFGDEDPVGKTLYYEDTGEGITISAVIKNFPKNSSMQNGIYLHMPEADARNGSFQMFLTLKNNDPNSFNIKINKDPFRSKLNGIRNQDSSYEITSLNKVYLYSTNMEGTRRINTTLTYAGIGILIMLIVFTNFINFAFAMAPSRVKNFNIHKILGINKWSLKSGIAFECVALSLVSFIAALFFVKLFSSSTLTYFFSTDLSLSKNIVPLITIGISLLIISYLIGFYSSRYATSFNEALALKGSFAHNKSSGKRRNTLIVVQFTAAIALITVAGFIKIQHDYVQNYSWGIDTENVLCVNTRGIKGTQVPFVEEVTRDSRISDYARSDYYPGNVSSSWAMSIDGEKKLSYVNVWPVDNRFIDFFDINLIAGRQFSEVVPGQQSIIVNQEFVKSIEIDETYVDRIIDGPFGQVLRLQGIAENINFKSLYENIGPMAFMQEPSSASYSYCFFRVKSDDIKGVRDQIEKTWGKFTNEQPDIFLLDEKIDRLYITESRKAKLVTICGLIILIVSVMGVYGLIMFNTRYKFKEIGIRKINGATSLEIIRMLNKNMVVLLMIAFLVAVPIAYYAIEKWLDNFAYKATIPWWLFLATGLLTLIISSLAVSWQSMKAANSNPVDALKTE